MKLTNVILRKTILLNLIGVLIFFPTVISGGTISPDTVLAEYDGGVITMEMFEEELSKIPEIYLARFRTLQGQKDFLTQLATRVLLIDKAEKLNYHQRENVQKRIIEELKPYIIQEYLRKNVNEKISFTREEKKHFYDNNIAIYTQSPNITIKYIQVKDNEDAQKLLDDHNKGVSFIDLMNNYSIHNFSKNSSGVIRNIRNNGYITGVGRVPDLDNLIAEAELNKLVGPVEVDSKIHFFIKTEHIPGSVTAFEDAVDDIINRIKFRKENELKTNLTENLLKKYNIEINEELLNQIDFTSQIEDNLQNHVLASSNREEIGITVKDFHNHFQRVDPQQRAQMQNPQFKLQALNEMITRELYYHEALNQNINIDTVLDNPEALRHKEHIILNELTDELVVEKSEPGELEILDYYEKNIELFRSRAHRTIQLFVFENRRTANRQLRNMKRAMRNDDEETIESIVYDHSLHKVNNGFISHVYEQGVIQGFGRDESILERVWGTKLNEVSDVFQNNKDQWTFLRVTEHYDSILNPLDNVRDRIVMTLRRQNIQRNWERFQEEIKQEYNLVLHLNRIQIRLTAEELFQLAEESQNRRRFDEAIMYYDQIIESYQNNEDDYKALFMKAFILTEELKMDNEAKELFKKLVNNYPYSDLHESAEFMIRSLESDDEFFIEFE